MYRAREKQMSIYDYLPPYHGELCNANRWVRLADAIDWDVFEKAYRQYFLGFESFTDAVPFSSRTVARFRARIPDKAVRPAVRLLRSFQ